MQKKDEIEDLEWHKNAEAKFEYLHDLAKTVKDTIKEQEAAPRQSWACERSCKLSEEAHSF